MFKMIQQSLNSTRIDCAVEDFFSARSLRLSGNTVLSYRNAFELFVEHVGADRPAHRIKPSDVTSFLSYHRDLDKSDSTLLRYYTALSALWTWLVKRDIVSEHIVRQVDPPEPEDREILPLTKDQIVALLMATDRSVTYRRSRDSRGVDHAAKNGPRDRALIYLLLDTGMRVSELCGLRVSDLTVDGCTVMGKGKKERRVPYSPTTYEFIWIYLGSRKNLQSGDLVFPILRRGVYGALARLGKRAAIKNVHPHRFRHTFAINFLRNGGDPYTLRRILGHATLEMVQTYLHIVQADLDRVHARSSPVLHWGL